MEPIVSEVCLNESHSTNEPQRYELQRCYSCAFRIHTSLQDYYDGLRHLPPTAISIPTLRARCYLGRQYPQSSWSRYERPGTSAARRTLVHNEELRTTRLS